MNHVYFVFTGIESVYEWKGEVWITFPINQDYHLNIE